MIRFESYEWLIYGLSLFSVVLFGALSGKIKNDNKKRVLLVRKVCVAVIGITSIYWIITFPYASSYFNPHSDSDFPSEISVEKQATFITENHRRIESLESELKRTKDELEAVTGRIQLFLQLFMYGMIFFISNWISGSNGSGSADSQENLNLDIVEK
jgi:hypothetical protein